MKPYVPIGDALRVAKVVEYQSISAYRVAQKLLNRPVAFEDPMAERLPCGGCGAPAGYFCLQLTGELDPLQLLIVTRFTCQEVFANENPRTLKAFAKAAEDARLSTGRKESK